MNPFLTLYTPAFRRPRGLARNFASVAAQTAVAYIEQIVIPDHVGIGIDGMFSRVQHYTGAVHGRYVAFLCDDDVLAGPDVVAQVQAHAEAEGFPALIVVQTEKNGSVWPSGAAWPPRRRRQARGADATPAATTRAAAAAAPPISFAFRMGAA